MPAYYWIQLYKTPTELDIEVIVHRTIAGLMDAGCRYQFTQATIIKDDSKPKVRQRPIKFDARISLGQAVQYAVEETKSWRTIEKADKWLPGITMVFEFDFQFDEEIMKSFDAETAKKVKQVRLDFWVAKDEIFEERIVINLDTWEEYVLMYGQENTHDHNKREILSIVESISNYITPHYGWLDGEGNSYDAQYGLIDKNDWSVRNEFVVVGPQLINRIPKHELDIISTLENGCLILRNSSSHQKAG